MKSPNYGGSWKGATPPRKMVEPVEVSLRLEKSHLDELKSRHGRDWQTVVGGLIAEYLNASLQL